jgi:4-oxalocrotonate tautomerase
MPLVTIDLLEGRTAAELEAISDAVHQVMVETMGVPERDCFQTITEHTDATLRFNRHYLNIERTDGFVMIRITLAAGRTTTAKRAFYEQLARLLGDRIGLRSEDLTVILIENEREDWSFGRGRANYLEIPSEEWC